MSGAVVEVSVHPKSRCLANRGSKAPFLQRAWLFFLPALFLPNLGYGRATPYGVLDLSDFLIGFYLLLLWLAQKPAVPRLVDRLTPLLAAFAVWALLSTATIGWRYGYPDNGALCFGLLKLAKLSLYGCAGLLTTARLGRPEVRRQFHWTLLWVVAVLGGSLLAMRPERDLQVAAEMVAQGYKSDNAVSIVLAVLACYLGALWVSGYGSRRWRKAALAAVPVGMAGSFVSSGRGGWVAAAAGLAYLLWWRGRRGACAAFAACLLALALVSYFAFPEFKKDVDRTISPGAADLEMYGAGVAGIDEGGRLVTWCHEVPKVLDAPLLGAGFYHRGGFSGLWTSGSHNFFIQMFLETGFVGGLLVLGAIRRMWRDAGSAAARAATQSGALRAALVAAIVGGMGGEYFYGGVPLLALLAVYAPTGALPACSGAQVRRPSRLLLAIRINA